MSTYLVALVAGPYAEWRDEHADDDGLHPARHLLPRLARRAHGRRAAVHRDQAGLRLLPPQLRHPVPVRQVRPAVRPRVQRGRDGERRRGDVPRGLRLPQPRHPLDLRAPRRDRAARDGAHVVRRPRHHALVGRPVAQRVVRDVRERALPGAGHRVHRGVDDLRERREELGVPPGPAAVHPPGGRRHPGPAGRRGQLRRDHLRQGRVGAQAARGLRRARAVPRRAARLLRGPQVGQRDVRRPARRARAGLGARPVRVGRAVAQDHRPEPAAALVRAGRRRHVRPFRGRPGRRPARRGRAAHAPDRRRGLRRRRLRQDRAHPPRRGRRRGRAHGRPRAARRLPREAGAGQRRRPHLLRAAPGPGLARHADRPDRRHRRAAAPHAVLELGVGDDPRGRAQGARLHRAGGGRFRRRDRDRGRPAAPAAGPDRDHVLRRRAVGRRARLADAGRLAAVPARHRAGGLGRAARRRQLARRQRAARVGARAVPRLAARRRRAGRADGRHGPALAAAARAGRPRCRRRLGPPAATPRR